MFPVLISAPSPTLFFVRDRSDKLDIDLEKINGSTYSPLKLHRVSFFLDVGLEGGSPMGFGFDGSIIISRTPSVSTPDEAIDCFNRVKASMMLGGLALDATTQSMIGFGELKESGYFRYHETLGAEARISQALQERGAGGNISICLLEPKQLTENEVKEAYSKGSRIFRLLTNLNAAFLTLSYSNLRKAETRNSLIFGWVACEQVVEHFWKDIFLSDASRYVSTDRRKRLLKTQSVAQKLDLLLQAAVISEKVYNALSIARKARNNFAHTGGAVSFEDAFQCNFGLLLLIQEYAALKNISSGIVDLTEILPSRDGDASEPSRSISNAKEVDWSRVKYFRTLYQIPGDETWEPGDERVDGHQIGPIETVE